MSYYSFISSVPSMINGDEPGFLLAVPDHQPFYAVNYFICYYILMLTNSMCKSLEVYIVKAVVKDLPIISNIIAKHSLSYPFLLILQDKGKDMYSSVGN